jgi:hypothetical protein
MGSACVTNGDPAAPPSTAVASPDVAPPAARFDTEDDFRHWFAYFYRHHRTDRLAPALQYMDKHGLIASDPDVATVFVARVFASAPGSLADYVSQIQALDEGLSQGAWSVVVVSLWMSKSPGAAALASSNLGRIEPDRRDRVADMLTRDPDDYDPLAAEVTDARQVNLLWAAFNATGDTQFVSGVIDQIHLYGTEDESMRGVIGETAIMTLAHNALYHPAVAILCERETAEHRNPRTRSMLGIMLQALAQFASGVDDEAVAH